MQQTFAHDLDEKERTKDVLLEENVSFTSLLLSSDIKRGLIESGYKKPSPIQFKAIPLGRCGFDLIVKSKSGTGKTLVFSTIALETVNVTKEYPQVLILVPTREIAVQIQDVLRCIGRFIDGLCVESFIGGMALEEDLKKVKRCHIAVGAPGRVKHLINLDALSTKSVRLFILDEADKLMESTFQKDINDIFDGLPQRKQMIAASATYPQELDTFLSNYMLSPTHVTSENETPLLLGLRQFVAVLKANAINAVQQMKAKNEILLDIFSKVSFTQCLVFTNYQSRTESVCNFLNQKGWNSIFISAAVEQSERLAALNNLKNFKNRILLSTDLTSRGIDAPNVDLVINYDLPHDAVTYLHRMGRAGRYGSSGICINLALDGPEIRKLQHILGTIGATNLSISKLPPLNGEDLWRMDLGGLEQVWGVVSETPTVGRDEIIKEVLSMKQLKKDNDKIKKKKSGKKIKVENSKKLEEKEVEDHEADTHLNDLKKDSQKNIKVEDKKMEEDEMENKYSTHMDTENLLSALLSGEATYDEDDSKKRKRAIPIKIEDLSNSENVQSILDSKKDIEHALESSESETMLMSLIEKAAVSDDDSKKRKLNNPDPDSLNQSTTKDTTFSKNKALLSITRLLCDSNLQVNPDFVEPIDGYLNILKTTRFKTEKSAEEILAETENSSNVPVTKTEGDFLEDIFKIGYQSAVKNEGSCLQKLPEDELQRFEEFCRQEQIVVSSGSEDEGVEDYEMEEYNEVAEEEEEEEEVEGTNGATNALQWFPVPEPESSNNHFAQCYEDCSNVLWQTGLTFETVAEFDNWYYQWQQQLHSVRNYVQQNIYVEEMSKYQHRLTNK